MADTTTTINVTELEKATSVQEGDTLLLVRTADDGSQTAYRVDGSNFRGEDAYTVAVAAGYAGTYEEWTAQCEKVAAFDVSYDADSGSIVIEK